MKDYKERLNKGAEEENQCCESPNIAIRDGTYVCLHCGVVFNRQLVEQEARAYSAEEVEKKKSNEPRWRDFGPRTTIQGVNADFKGGSVKSDQRTLFSRLSKIQNSLVNSIERNFWEAKPRMKLLVSKLNIPPHIHDTAWKIYTHSAKKRLTMGRSIDGFLAASVYVAIRIHEFPKLLEDVSDTAFVPRRTVIRSVALLIKEVLPELNLKYKPITAEQLIYKFGNELAVSIEIQQFAQKILAHSYQKGVSVIGKDPKGFAASAIYLALKNSKQRKTQTEIAEIAKITEVTLRTRIKDIYIKTIN